MPHLWTDLSTAQPSGATYTKMRAVAAKLSSTPVLHDGDNRHNVDTLATAYVAIVDPSKSNRDNARKRAEAALAKLGTVRRGDVALEPARQLCAYVLAADVLGYRTPKFEAALRDILTHHFPKTHSVKGGGTLVEMAAQSPNNHGAMARASVLAAALYLGDQKLVRLVAYWHVGWCGTGDYRDFNWTDTDWHFDPDNPVGINPSGSMVAYVLPEDQRRGGDRRFPIPNEGYVHGALGAALVTHALLNRAGLIELSDEDPLLQAFLLYDRLGYEPEGDDQWQPWTVNSLWGTDLSTKPEKKPGKQIAWTSFSHGGN